MRWFTQPSRSWEPIAALLSMNSLKVLFRLYCHLGSEGSESP